MAKIKNEQRDKHLNINTMNIRKILGPLLIILVIGGISFPAILFVNLSDGQFVTKALIIFGTAGLIFFITSISLISKIKDK